MGRILLQPYCNTSEKSYDCKCFKCARIVNVVIKISHPMRRGHSFVRSNALSAPIAPKIALGTHVLIVAVS